MPPSSARARDLGRRLLHGLSRVWLAVGLTLSLLLAAESVARLALAARGRPPDPRIRADSYPREPWVAELYEENARSARMRWEPSVYWRRLPFAGRHIHIDDRGLRRTWRAARRTAPGAPPLRVFVFGASSLWGTGVRDDHTIPSELARYLAVVDIPAEVTNFGESGYVSTQEVIGLLRELQRGDVPDLAVFYLGLNDTFSAFQNRVAGVPTNEEHRAREFNLLRHARRLLPEALRALAARSALLRLAGLGVPPPPSPAPFTAPPGLVEDTLRALDANLRAVDGLAASYGFRVSIFWEPCILEKRHLTPYERSRAAALADSRGWLLETYARVERDWAARDPDELTYLGNFFAGTSGPRFIDHVHLGEAGNREIAAAIGRQLSDHGRLRRRSAPAAPVTGPRPVPAPPAAPAAPSPPLRPAGG